MRINVSRNNLLDGLKKARSFTAKEEVKPVLKSVKISTVDNNKIILEGNNLEMCITVSINCTVTDSGDALIDPKIISILSESQSEEVQIETDGKTANFELANGKFKIPYEDPASFPVSGADFSNSIEVNTDDFRNLISATSFAVASAEHSRFGATTGMLLQIKNKRIYCVGTCGRRMSVAKVEADLPDSKQYVIPKPCADLLKTINGESGKVRIGLHDYKICFDFGGIIVTSRLVEGQFPQFDKIISKDFRGTNGTADAKELLSIVKQSRVLATEENKSVIVEMSSDKITITAKTERGDSWLECDCKNSGNDSEVKVDPQFIIDFLTNVRDDGSLEFQTPNKDEAVYFKSKRGNVEVLYCVVPLTLKQSEKKDGGTNG